MANQSDRTRLGLILFTVFICAGVYLFGAHEFNYACQIGVAIALIVSYSMPNRKTTNQRSVP